MKKILLVVESIDVDDSSGSKANVSLIRNLKLCGYYLKVYHYTLKEIHLPSINCTAVKENRKSPLFFLSRAERYMRNFLKIGLHKPLQKKFGFSFTLLNDRNSIVTALRQNINFEPELVITLSKGGSFRPHHALLKIPEWHHKWLAYMHDPYPMHHYPAPFTWTEPGFEKKEDFVRMVSQKAAFSAFPSQLLLKWMGNFYPNFLKTGTVIPHQIFQFNVNKVRLPEYFDPEKFNLLHAGNLLGARDPNILVAGFSEFLKKNPRSKDFARLIFVGGNNERVRKAAKESPNILASEAYVKFEQVYKMQMGTAVNIILEAKADLSPFLPGKFSHCVSADKPILLLGPQKSESRRLLGESYPFWSEIDDLQKISNHIEKMYFEWEKSPLEFKLNRPDLKEYLSQSHLRKVMNQILKAK